MQFIKFCVCAVESGRFLHIDNHCSAFTSRFRFIWKVCYFLKYTKFMWYELPVYDSLSKDSLPNGFITLLPKCRQTLCRNVASYHSLMLAKWLIDFNRSHSLILKRVSLWKCFICPFQCKTLSILNLVISTYCPSINCPSVKSLSTRNRRPLTSIFVAV